MVDVNPRKHGQIRSRVLPMVVNPNELKVLWPDAVLIMNELYGTDIRQTLTDMKLSTAIHGV